MLYFILCLLFVKTRHWGLVVQNTPLYIPSFGVPILDPNPSIVTSYTLGSSMVADSLPRTQWGTCHKSCEWYNNNMSKRMSKYKNEQKVRSKRLPIESFCIGPIVEKLYNM